MSTNTGRVSCCWICFQSCNATPVPSALWSLSIASSRATLKAHKAGNILLEEAEGNVASVLHKQVRDFSCPAIASSAVCMYSSYYPLSRLYNCTRPSRHCSGQFQRPEWRLWAASTRPVMFYAQNNIILWAIHWATLLGLQIKSITLIMLLVVVNPGLARNHWR